MVRTTHRGQERIAADGEFFSEFSKSTSLVCSLPLPADVPPSMSLPAFMSTCAASIALELRESTL